MTQEACHFKKEKEKEKKRERSLSLDSGKARIVTVPQYHRRLARHCVAVPPARRKVRTENVFDGKLEIKRRWVRLQSNKQIVGCGGLLLIKIMDYVNGRLDKSLWKHV
jgi:hypothetical protein